jgi:hypothetical protein
MLFSLLHPNPRVGFLGGAKFYPPHTHNSTGTLDTGLRYTGYMWRKLGEIRTRVKMIYNMLIFFIRIIPNV